MWTVIQLIQTTAELLAKHGSPSPRVDAEVLLGHALGESRTWLYMNAQRPVSDDERSAYRALVSRRATGEPVAYILGEAGFWSLELQVDARVLVPRPETERLIETALELLGAVDRSDWRIVDVGTGSGAIALALATELPGATVLATDISADALEVARGNADRWGLRDRVRFARGDLLAALSGRREAVDVVVSNPPYVGTNDPDLASNVREHEPATALFAGEDGLDVIRRLIPASHDALVPGGVLLVEFGSRQGAAVAALARAHFADVSIVADYAGHDRVLVARKAGALGPPVAAPDAGPDAPDAAQAGARDAAEGAESDADPGADVGVDELSVGERMLAEAAEAGLPVLDINEM